MLSQRINERNRERLYGPALICSVIANTHRDPKKKRTPFTPDDFLPSSRKRPEINGPEQSPEAMLKIAMLLTGTTELAAIPPPADQ